MFTNMAKQIMLDAETFASNDRDCVREHHIAQALFKSRGISATVLKSVGITLETLPASANATKNRFTSSWKQSNLEMYVTLYSPEVMAVWHHAQSLLEATGRGCDATEYFLLGLFETGDYGKGLCEVYEFSMSKVYARIKHLQILSIWTANEAEGHSRRLLALAQEELREGNLEQALKLVKLALLEIRTARRAARTADVSVYLNLQEIEAQILKCVGRFYNHAAEQREESKFGKLATIYNTCGEQRFAKVTELQQHRWRSSILGFEY